MPPGGLVAGDELHQQFTAQEGSAGLITTPAAGKVYFNSLSYQQAQDRQRRQQQFTTLTIKDKASLEWLPQETILFNGADTELHTHIELEGSGQYAGWEIVCLGRKASGESFTQGNVTQTLSLKRHQTPLFLERLHFQAPSQQQTTLLGLNGCHVFGTFIMTLPEAPDCEDWQARIERQQLQNVLALTWRAGGVDRTLPGPQPGTGQAGLPVSLEPGETSL